jgi:hypothetical protein
MPNRLCALLCLVLAAVAAQAAPTEETITLPSGVPIVSERYAAHGADLVLWLTGDSGQENGEARAAEYLAAHGLETWLTDWLSPYFLPALPSSVDRVPAADLADWLEAVRKKAGGRRFVLVAAGHASAWALLAVKSWRERYGKGVPDPTAGALLLYPILYHRLEPGQAPEYDSVVSDTPIRAVVLQPASSVGYWWRDRLKAAMEAAGSRVWVEVLPGVRDGYYRRADVTPREQAEARRLGETLQGAMRPLLERTTP